MIITEYFRHKVDNMSFASKHLAKVLIAILEKLDNGECSEDDVGKFMANKEVHENSYNEKRLDKRR